MKRSQLREIVLEAMAGGYVKGRDGKLVPHYDKFDSTKLSSILTQIVKGRPEEGDPVRGNKILDKANPDNVARITRGEKPIYEGDKKLYSKQEAADYIKNNPPAKYYKIGVSSNSVQQARSIEDAINIIDQSPIKQFELSTYGQVIQFSAPFDAGHAASVRGMGGLD